MSCSASERSLLQWETRLLPLDPVTVSHVLKNPNIYEKPSTYRRQIEWLIGCGVHAAEGNAHKHQRRITAPAFSIQNMRTFVPLIFNKGEELKDKWMGLIQEQDVKDTQKNPTGLQLDVCDWVSRATFDVIGLAGAFLPSAASPHQSKAPPRFMFRVRLSPQCHSKRRQRSAQSI